MYQHLRPGNPFSTRLRWDLATPHTLARTSHPVPVISDVDVPGMRSAVLQFKCIIQLTQSNKLFISFGHFLSGEDS